MSERYQERVYKTELETAYDDTYSRIREMIRKSFLSLNYQEHNLAIDLEAMLYVVSDFVAYNIDRRDTIENELLHHRGFYYFDFKSRVEFYGKIANGTIKPRGDCIVDLPTSITDNPLTRCVIAFCDILKNPSLLDEYNSSPLLVLGIDKEFVFVKEIVMPMVSVVLEYISDIMKLCGVEEMPQEETSQEELKNSQKELQVQKENNDSSKLTITILSIALIVLLTILYFVLQS